MRQQKGSYYDFFIQKRNNIRNVKPLQLFVTSLIILLNIYELCQGTSLTSPGTTLTSPGTTLTSPGTTLTSPGTSLTSTRGTSLTSTRGIKYNFSDIYLASKCLLIINAVVYFVTTLLTSYEIINITIIITIYFFLMEVIFNNMFIDFNNTLQKSIFPVNFMITFFLLYCICTESIIVSGDHCTRNYIGPYINGGPYNKKEKSSCSTCLEEYKESDIITKLSCGHIFHEKCLNDWLKTLVNVKSCSLCRRTIID